MAFSAGQVLTAAQLNNLDITTLTTTGVVDIPDGAVGTPSLAHTGDLNTGMYFPANDAVALVAAGVDRLRAGTGSTILAGPNQEANIIYLQATSTAPTSTEGDVWLRFGDTDDTSQAAIQWDQSDTDFRFYGYNQDLTFTINASEQVEFVNGTAANPTIVWSGDPDTGFYWEQSGRIAWSGNQTFGGELTGFGVETVDGTASRPGYAFSTDIDTGMYLIADAQLSFACGGTESFRIVDSGATQEIFPGADGTFLLGVSNRRWEEIYCSNGTINTSDIRLKDQTGDALGLDFVNKLRPFAGTWKPEHRSHRDPGRVHQWLSAQDVAAALDASGVDPATTAMWRGEGDDQALAYGELIPVLVAAVQELADKIDAL